MWGTSETHDKHNGTVMWLLKRRRAAALAGNIIQRAENVKQHNNYRNRNDAVLQFTDLA